MLRRILAVIGITAAVMILPIGGAAAFADGPYSDNPSGYCSDGWTPPGANFEASTPTPVFGTSVGVQFGQDSSRPSQIAFYDTCVVVEGPSVCIPFVGICAGGKIMGSYESERFYTGDPCYYQYVSHYDHDGTVKGPYQYYCV